MEMTAVFPLRIVILLVILFIWLCIVALENPDGP
jgi:hypothetical protein